jgi:hypothetical protein
VQYKALQPYDELTNIPVSGSASLLLRITGMASCGLVLWCDASEVLVVPSLVEHYSPAAAGACDASPFRAAQASTTPQSSAPRLRCL